MHEKYQFPSIKHSKLLLVILSRLQIKENTEKKLRIEDVMKINGTNKQKCKIGKCS